MSGDVDDPGGSRPDGVDLYAAGGVLPVPAGDFARRLTDEPGRRDVVDLSPYVGRLAIGDDDQAPALDVSRLTFRRERPRPPLDGPGYLVVHRGELGPGSPVAIGTMPRGISGGVGEWAQGRVASVDGEAVAGEPGWYVPVGASSCPRCGDQNWDVTRKCITCTDGDDGYAGGAFRDGWSVSAAERLGILRG